MLSGFWMTQRQSAHWLTAPVRVPPAFHAALRAALPLAGLVRTVTRWRLEARRRILPARAPQVFGAAAVALALSVTITAPAFAHSLTELEKELLKREAYVQLVERPAPAFNLLDASGKEVKLSDFRGKIVVLWFVFAGCTDVCPLQSQAIAEMQAQINLTPMRDMVQFITITTDPTKDTPEIMQAYGPTQGLDPANWVFLTSGSNGPEDATRRLAREYGLEFTPTEDGAQFHGVVTHLIDRDGQMRARYHGLKFGPTNFIVHVNALTNNYHHQKDKVQTPSLWQRARALFSW